MYDELRHRFALELEHRLKPERFWVTDFLAQRIMDVEMTFASGDPADTETVKRCAEYSSEILQIGVGNNENLAASIERSPITEELKGRIRALVATADELTGEQQASEEQAYEAVSCFMHVVFTRREL
ncbi:MAG: hypothetical protein C4K60_10760 [Ideonella sp. MAG2]|nr:MAG: hypothetical protein C4K60_10760 [Ideonella sp. MAG2]